MGLRKLPISKIVSKETISVSVKITCPVFVRSLTLFSAKAYAIAPLRPAIHIVNYMFHLIFVSYVLPKFTNQLTITILRALAMNKLIMVVRINSHDIWL